MTPLNPVAGQIPRLPPLPATPAIHRVGSIQEAAPTAPLSNFGQLLQSSLNQVNQLQHQANDASMQLLTGGPVSSAEVFTAVQKADLALRTLVQIRNKLLQAYQELMAMQV
jgi:flagellar hook-basal body complex protein FliE